MNQWESDGVNGWKGKWKLIWHLKSKEEMNEKLNQWETDDMNDWKRKTLKLFLTIFDARDTKE